MLESLPPLASLPGRRIRDGLATGHALHDPLVLAGAPLRVSDFAQTAAVQAGIVLPNRGLALLRRPPLACVVVAGVGAAVINRLQLW
jgi:hypothetical protein